MMTTKYAPGTIFYLQDRFSTNQNHNSHNYLIMGKSPCKMGFIQAMSITSMKNKEIEMEVPILLCNNLISYIVPHNVQSFLDSDVELSQYKGQILDTELISKNSFLEMLMDIYLDGLNLGIKPHAEVKKRYESYCENFFNVYKESKEYRNRENSDNCQFQKKSPVISPDNSNVELDKKDNDGSFNRIVISKEIKDQVALIETDRMNKIHTNAKTWTDKELLQFLSVIDSNRGNQQFKLEFTNYQTPRQVVDKTYEVRTEARKRNLIKK